MSDAWSLFEEAVAASKESRRDRLLSVLGALEVGPLVDAADRAELQAVVQCELARLGASSIESALDAVKAAEGYQRIGWPNYYLAQSAIQVGANDIALESLHKIAEDFFVQRDLLWRMVHCWELGAIARLGIGDWEGARVLVDQIAAALASRGESDDLAPPKDLVNRLLTCVDAGQQAARELLVTMASSVDVTDWFGDRLARRIREAIEAPTIEPPALDLGTGFPSVR